MSLPLVSIITPNFNAVKFISQTINSVLNQTYENWEMLIVDDCSSDNSVEIIEKFASEDSRIKLFKLTQNSGPAICRNKGIEMARGSFITFIDADDLWKPEFLKASIQQEKKSFGFVFASYHCYNENLEPIFKDFIVPKKVTYHDILKQNSISCLTAFINIEKLGKFKMPNVMYRQDMGLWLRYLKTIDYAIGIEKPLAIYRIREKSHSRNKFKLLKHQWFFYRNVEGISFLKTCYYFSYWMYRGFKKYYR